MTEVKKKLGGTVSYDEEGFRMSTPQAIARYKAERLKTKTVADLGAGIGIQALSFAEVSERVIAVEIDVERTESLRKNAETAGTKNLEIVLGDALDSEVVRKLGNVDAIHSDPSRKKGGESWNFTDLSPNPLEVIKQYRCDTFSFDLPALFPMELIPEEWEVEYVSLSGELKRIGTYLGGARRFQKSVVTLPSMERIIARKDLSRTVDVAQLPSKWIYDLDGSMYYSKMIPEFLKTFDGLSLLHQDRQKTLLTGEKLRSSSFLIRTYSVLDHAASINEVKSRLIEQGAGNVVLRFSMDPSQYYEERRNIRKGLEGTKTIYIFRFNSNYYLAERTGEADNSQKSTDG